jgi:hypothetical protein
MTLTELNSKRNVLLADAKFYHEQGCFSCYTECAEKAKALEAEIESIRIQGEMFKEDTK